MNEDEEFDCREWSDCLSCLYCGGEGRGLVGCDWSSHDPINGPYDGEIEECPCCHGSGKAEDCTLDCTFW